MLHSVAPAQTGTSPSRRRGGSISGAAGVRVAELLAGTPRTGTVLHRGRDAVYVEVGSDCLGVLSRNAVHVPCAILTALPSLSGLHGLSASPAGGAVEVGDGRLVIDGLAVSVARTVPTTAPALPDPAGALDLLVQAVRVASGDDLRNTRADLPAEALADLTAGDPASVPALLGRGSGLTPLGDDVLAGWLVTARATGLTSHDKVRVEVGRLARSRTTTLSAALLNFAGHGESIPQFRRLLLTLGSGSTAEVAVAVRALLAVGHTSGAGMTLGCLLALTAVEGITR